LEVVGGLWGVWRFLGFWGFWKFLKVFGSRSRFLAVFGEFWRFLGYLKVFRVFGRFWKLCFSFFCVFFDFVGGVWVFWEVSGTESVTWGPPSRGDVWGWAF
jgi:hypothetical protein